MIAVIANDRSVIDLFIYLVIHPSICSSTPPPQLPFQLTMLEEREICFKKVFMSFSQSSFLCSQINHFPTVFFSLLLVPPPPPLFPWRSKETWDRASIKITLHHWINELRSYQRKHYNILKLHVTIFICLTDDPYISILFSFRLDRSSSE